MLTAAQIVECLARARAPEPGAGWCRHFAGVLGERVGVEQWGLMWV